MNSSVSHMDHLVSSPCCLPRISLDFLLAAYEQLGFRKFEAFTSWCVSHLEINENPQHYLDLIEQYDMRYSSMHLPPVNDDFKASLQQAVQAARFAEQIGASVVLYKANSRENYIKAARPFLDAIEENQIAVTPVLQNHAGTAISTPEDFREVIEGINDKRMKTLLEVGHFQRVGVHWQDGYDLLGDSIGLVHVNDVIGRQSVPYGTGEVDMPGLFSHLRHIGYQGDVVVELELETRDTDPEQTMHYLEEALDYLQTHCSDSEGRLL